MLKPNVEIKEFEKYGFKKCKRPYDNCYYLCVAKGIKMIFVSPVCFEIFDWKEDDPRIHRKPNCRYNSRVGTDDIVYQLIKDGLLISDIEFREV